MASLEGDIEGGEVVLVLGLVILIGYGLYKFSQSFAAAIDGIFGLSSGAAGPKAGGSYVNAANQVVTDPMGSMESILGIGPAYPTESTIIGSTQIPTTTSTPAEQVNNAFATGSSL